MKTYWDLSEAERAALTEEDVQRFLDAELMQKGVLKVRPLVLEPEPTVPPPYVAVFAIRLTSYSKADLVFETLEAAKACIALQPKLLEQVWVGSDHVEVVEQVAQPEVSEVCVYTKEQVTVLKGDLSKAAAIRKANADRTTQYETAVKARDEALRHLWEDWARCREEEAKLREVADTFADYQKIAGSNVIATQFLEKVYPVALIEDAAERFSLPLARPEKSEAAE